MQSSHRLKMKIANESDSLFADYICTRLQFCDSESYPAEITVHHMSASNSLGKSVNHAVNYCRWYKVIQM